MIFVATSDSGTLYVPDSMASCSSSSRWERTSLSVAIALIFPSQSTADKTWYGGKGSRYIWLFRHNGLTGDWTSGLPQPIFVHRPLWLRARARLQCGQNGVGMNASSKLDLLCNYASESQRLSRELRTTPGPNTTKRGRRSGPKVLDFSQL